MQRGPATVIFPQSDCVKLSLRPVDVLKVQFKGAGDSIKDPPTPFRTPVRPCLTGTARVPTVPRSGLLGSSKTSGGHKLLW